ncbi:MAG: transcription elongation factor Spt5 [Candidatus Diapherotrites archaeon]|uniref:Transcription elongation factor Spt5 n=1 Tax=Candidatus Iainarchaeum sp. TaxID=3101447 RepID=A0A938YVD4_9ARCH|nr:transcription elongation factor Spt5 [Candidatus Diapherotrites archaeon]
MPIYPVRTTVGQESLVVDILNNRIKSETLPIYSISVIPGLKGYVLIEAQDELTIRLSIANTPHIKGQGIVKGAVKADELGGLLESKPLMQSIKEGAKVELIAGPFKRERAKVLRVNPTKEEVTVELLEAAVKIPLTIKAEHIRIIKE